MLCENCNYILTGKENFCPNCASPIKREYKGSAEKEKIRVTETQKLPDISENGFVFQQNSADVKLRKEDDIFYDTHELEIIDEKMKTKSTAGRIFVLLFALCALTAGALAVADYFDITPSVFGFIHAVTASDGKTESAFDHQSSVRTPDINCTPCIAYVSSGKGLTLRKGPGNSYAPLEKLTEFTCVEIRGESVTQENWVYVYCGEALGYGWLDGSFLAKDKE